uniref:Homeobox domain-containing protein n=2 Tax=Trichobilharzia regenti TaxID=157069 RepID=A0AA85JZL0_TRIRE|nr:unnamed protein product [Trichobilharzia regenti]
MPRRRRSSPANTTTTTNTNTTTTTTAVSNNNNNSNNNGRAINTSTSHQHYQYHNHHSTHNNNNNSSNALRFRGGRSVDTISPLNHHHNRSQDTQETQDCHVSSTTTNLMQEIQSHPLYPLLALLLQQCEIATARPDSPPPLDTFTTELTSYIQRRIEQQHQQQQQQPQDEEVGETDDLKPTTLKLSNRREKNSKINEKFGSTEDLGNRNIETTSALTTADIPMTTKTTGTTNTTSSNANHKTNSTLHTRNNNERFSAHNKLNNETSSQLLDNTDIPFHKSTGCSKMSSDKNNNNNSDHLTNDISDISKQNCTFNDERKYQFLSNNSELDELIVKAIQVLRIHLLELHKVNELCKDFCSRYIYSLKSKFQSDPLIHDSQPSSPGESEALSPMAASGCYNPRYHHHHPMLGSNFPYHPGSTDMIPPGYRRHLSGRLDDDSLCGSSDVENPRSGCLHSNSLHNLNRTGYDMQGSCYNTNFHTVDYNSPYFMDKSMIQEDGSVSCDESLSQLHSFLSPYGGSSTLSSAAFHASLDGLCVGGKQKRGVLPKRATQIMKQWLFQHLVHPYPTEDEKRQIASQTNLTLLQVNNWFINARRRILQPMLDSSNFVPLGNNCNSVDGSSDRMSGSIGSSETHVISKKKKAATSRPSNNRFWPASLVAAAAIHPAAAGLVSSGSSSGFSAAINSTLNSTSNSNAAINTTTTSSARSDCHTAETRPSSLDEVNSDTSVNSLSKHPSKCGYIPQNYESLSLPNSSEENHTYDNKLSSDLWNLDTRTDLFNSHKFYSTLQSGLPSIKMRSNANDNNLAGGTGSISDSSTLSSQNHSFPIDANQCLSQFSSTTAIGTDPSQMISGKYDPMHHENLNVKQSDEIVNKHMTSLMMSSSCSNSKETDQGTDTLQQQQQIHTDGVSDKSFSLNKPVDCKSLFISSNTSNNNNNNNNIPSRSEVSTDNISLIVDRNFREFNPVLSNISVDSNESKGNNSLENGLLDTNLMNTDNPSGREFSAISNGDNTTYGLRSQNDLAMTMMMMNSSASNYPQNYSSMLLSHAQTYSNYLSNSMSMSSNLLPFDIHNNNNPNYNHGNNASSHFNQLNYTSHTYPNIANLTTRQSSGFNQTANFPISNLNNSSTPDPGGSQQQSSHQHSNQSPSIQHNNIEVSDVISEHWSRLTDTSSCSGQFKHNLNSMNHHSFPTQWTNKLKEFSSSTLQNHINAECLSASSEDNPQRHQHAKQSHHPHHPHHGQRHHHHPLHDSQHHNESDGGQQFLDCLRSSSLLSRNDESSEEQLSGVHTSGQMFYNHPSDINNNNNSNYTHTESSLQDALNSKSIYPIPSYDHNHHHHHPHHHQQLPHHPLQYNSTIPFGHITNMNNDNTSNFNTMECTDTNDNNTSHNDNNKTSVSFFKSPPMNKPNSNYIYPNS